MIVHWEQTIYGQPASKANRRRPTKQGLFIKSKDAMRYEKEFAQQVRRPAVPIRGPVAVTIQIAYRSWRSDLDESLILDLLQKHGIYENDRQVVDKAVARLPCSDTPLSKILVLAVPFDGPTPASWKEKP